MPKIEGVVDIDEEGIATCHGKCSISTDPFNVLSNQYSAFCFYIIRMDLNQDQKDLDIKFGLRWSETESITFDYYSFLATLRRSTVNPHISIDGIGVLVRLFVYEENLMIYVNDVLLPEKHKVRFSSGSFFIGETSSLAIIATSLSDKTRPFFPTMEFSFVGNNSYYLVDDTVIVNVHRKENDCEEEDTDSCFPSMSSLLMMRQEFPILPTINNKFMRYLEITVRSMNKQSSGHDCRIFFSRQFITELIGDYYIFDIYNKTFTISRRKIQVSIGPIVTGIKIGIGFTQDNQIFFTYNGHITHVFEPEEKFGSNPIYVGLATKFCHEEYHLNFGQMPFLMKNFPKPEFTCWTPERQIISKVGQQRWSKHVLGLLESSLRVFNPTTHIFQPFLNSFIYHKTTNNIEVSFSDLRKKMEIFPEFFIGFSTPTAYSAGAAAKEPSIACVSHDGKFNVMGTLLDPRSFKQYPPCVVETTYNNHIFVASFDGIQVPTVCIFNQVPYPCINNYTGYSCFVNIGFYDTYSSKKSDSKTSQTNSSLSQASSSSVNFSAAGTNEELSASEQDPIKLPNKTLVVPDRTPKEEFNLVVGDIVESRDLLFSGTYVGMVGNYLYFDIKHSTAVPFEYNDFKSVLSLLRIVSRVQPIQRSPFILMDKAVIGSCIFNGVNRITLKNGKIYVLCATIDNDDKMPIYRTLTSFFCNDPLLCGDPSRDKVREIQEISIQEQRIVVTTCQTNEQVFLHYDDKSKKIKDCTYNFVFGKTVAETMIPFHLFSAMCHLYPSNYIGHSLSLPCSIPFLYQIEGSSKGPPILFQTEHILVKLLEELFERYDNGDLNVKSEEICKKHGYVVQENILKGFESDEEEEEEEESEIEIEKEKPPQTDLSFWFPNTKQRVVQATELLFNSVKLFDDDFDPFEKSDE